MIAYIPLFHLRHLSEKPLCGVPGMTTTTAYYGFHIIDLGTKWAVSAQRRMAGPRPSIFPLYLHYQNNGIRRTSQVHSN